MPRADRGTAAPRPAARARDEAAPDGRTIRSVGTFAAEGHGTAVAAVVAGVRDGAGMSGIAPGAALHLSSFLTGFSGIAAATRGAIASDAVVQNDPWSFVDGLGAPIPITVVEAYLEADADATLSEALQASLGGSRAASRTIWRPFAPSRPVASWSSPPPTRTR